MQWVHWSLQHQIVCAQNGSVGYAVAAGCKQIDASVIIRKKRKDSSITQIQLIVKDNPMLIFDAKNVYKNG